MTERIVVVTGSTSGIGEGIALRFAQGGDHLVVHGLDEPIAAAAADRVTEAGPGEVHLVTGDLTDPTVAERLVEETVRQFGRVDVLVNSAGRNVFTGVLDSSLEDWQRAIDLNLRAAWLVSRAAAPHMLPGSAIVIISSNHARSTMPGCFPYNVAKAGLLGLTNALAVDLAKLGIRANAVLPGWTETPPISQDLVGAGPDERKRVEGLHLTGRMATPADIAEAVWYLAGASQVTGTHLLVDGGRSAQMEDPH